MVRLTVSLYTENFRDPYINDEYWTQLKDMIEHTCKNLKVPDIIFFIITGSIFLKKNRTHAFESISQIIH